MKKLIEIQSELKCPKKQYNSFGKYSFRNSEDILESVKPILKKHNCILTISDQIVDVGGRIYVQATATLKHEAESVTVTAYAREPESLKGMSESQVTGSTSSYARKYALNGLFLIDDSQDSDVTNTDTDLGIEAVLVAVSEAKTKEDLITIWNDNKPLQANKEFLAAIQERKKDLA